MDEHLTRLTCNCGNTIEVKSKSDWGYTESFGDPYSKISFDLPKDWTWSDCPKCRPKE